MPGITAIYLTQLRVDVDGRGPQELFELEYENKVSEVTQVSERKKSHRRERTDKGMRTGKDERCNSQPFSTRI